MVRINLLILLISCSTLMHDSAMAQDSILFISGRILDGNVTEVDSFDVQVELKKRKKTKLSYVPKSDVFAIKYADGRIDIFYKPIHEEEYTIREMELFVKGEQDALQNTKAPFFLAAGVMIGGVSVAVLGPFYGLIPLMPYALLSGSFTNRVKEKSTSNADIVREDAYVTGYVTKAKNVKIQKAITGSIIGWVAGLAAIAINNKLNPPD